MVEQKLSPYAFHLWGIYHLIMPTNPVTKPKCSGEAVKEFVEGPERTEDDNRSRPWQKALESDKERRGTEQEDTADMWVAAQGTVAA
jgi:hypothetical protein